MKKAICLVLLTSLTSVNSFAADAVLLMEGDRAPFTGLLMTQDKANEVKVQLLERDTYKLLNISYESSLSLMNSNIKLKDEQLDLAINQNTKLSQQLREQKDFNSWERFAWFALGVLGTSIAVYGVQKATR